jgi:hypothetical protein
MFAFLYVLFGFAALILEAHDPARVHPASGSLRQYAALEMDGRFGEHWAIERLAAMGR